MFGSNKAQDTLGDKFLEYLAASAPGEQEENAELFATKSWVVGKHFLDRHDYKTARQVFEPWLAEGYGEPMVLTFGRVSLGFVYQAMGEKQLAIDMFTQGEEYYRTSRLKNTADHAVPVIQAANLSGDVAEMGKATELIDLVLSNEETDPYSRTFLIMEKYKLETRQADWEAAYASIKRGIELIESGAFGRVSSVDIYHTRYARMNVFYKRDLALAKKYLSKGQEVADNYKGENLVLGFITDLRAVLAWDEKDYAAALTHSKKALEIFEQYTGQADYYASGLAKQGIILADAGSFDLAATTLAQLQALPSGHTPVTPDVLNLYISARQKGMAAAQQQYQDTGFPVKDVLSKLEPAYFLDVLQTDGLQL